MIADSLCDNVNKYCTVNDVMILSNTTHRPSKYLHTILFLKFYDYVDKKLYSANEAILIRDLCIKQDSRDFSFFNSDELNEMVILLCTT